MNIPNIHRRGLIHAIYATEYAKETKDAEDSFIKVIYSKNLNENLIINTLLNIFSMAKNQLENAKSQFDVSTIDGETIEISHLYCVRILMKILLTKEKDLYNEIHNILGINPRTEPSEYHIKLVKGLETYKLYLELQKDLPITKQTIKREKI